MKRSMLHMILLCFGFNVKHAVSQPVDACAPVGWVNYNNTNFAGPPIGGGNATPVIVNTLAALKTVAAGNDPRVIYVQGTIGNGYINGAGDRIDVGSNKTIIGYPGTVIRAFMSIRNATNVIVRNLIFEGPGAADVDGWDNITIDNATRVWIDHCELRDGEDGNLDIKNAANNITITWTRFRYSHITQARGALNHSFSNLIGSSDGATQDEGKLKVTFQYNWWEGAVERMPRVRYGQVHVVNNLFTEVSGQPQSKSGVTAGYNANVRVERNVFIGINNPIDISKMAGTSSIQSINNLMINVTGNTTGSGTAFSPPYTLNISEPEAVNTNTFRNCVGATLSAPPASACPCANPLDVQLLEFEVVKVENSSFMLTWKVLNGESLTSLIPEYTLTLTTGNFLPIDSLSPTVRHYVLPTHILSSQSKELYVRVKFVETNGNVHYSPVRVIYAHNSEVNIHPNPFHDNIYIDGLTKGKIKLLSLQGYLLYECAWSNDTPVVITFPANLSAATYIIQIIDEHRQSAYQQLIYKN